MTRRRSRPDPGRTPRTGFVAPEIQGISKSLTPDRRDRDKEEVEIDVDALAACPICDADVADTRNGHLVPCGCPASAASSSTPTVADGGVDRGEGPTTDGGSYVGGDDDPTAEQFEGRHLPVVGWDDASIPAFACATESCSTTLEEGDRIAAAFAYLDPSLGDEESERADWDLLDLWCLEHAPETIPNPDADAPQVIVTATLEAEEWSVDHLGLGIGRSGYVLALKDVTLVGGEGFDRGQGTATDGGTDEDDEWNPEPASLREGETRDDTHARRNLQQLKTAREDLEEPPESIDERIAELEDEIEATGGDGS